MKALQFMSPNIMAVNEIAIPKIADDEVLLASRSVGICHSDIHQVREEWGAARFPMVPGHEIGGIVAAVGSNVTKFTIGDAV